MSPLKSEFVTNKEIPSLTRNGNVDDSDEILDEST